jgi:hypothetical protein
VPNAPNLKAFGLSLKLQINGRNIKKATVKAGSTTKLISSFAALKQAPLFYFY